MFFQLVFHSWANIPKYPKPQTVGPNPKSCGSFDFSTPSRYPCISLHQTFLCYLHGSQPRHEPAGVASKLESDSSNVYLFMSTVLGHLIVSLAQFATGLFLAVYEGWQLAFVVCATMPVLILAGHRMGKEVEYHTTIQQAKFARASAVAEESLMAIRSVAAFGGENMEAARFEKELSPAKVAGIRTGAKIGAAWGVLNFFYPGLYALALWYGGHVLMRKENAGFEASRIVAASADRLLLTGFCA